MVRNGKWSVGRLAAAALAISFLFAACGAQIANFSASSRYICAGQPVHLSWKVTGTATMTATPPLAPRADASKSQAISVG
jgi:hypothetical protein